MLKKILSVSAVLMLAGCAAESKNEPFPGEFANADYVLSDENAKRWVVASHKAEQCIYPNLTRIQQQHFSKEDAYIHSQYVFFYPLEDVIGAEYVKIIQDDEKSMGYATHLFKKYKTLAFEPLNAKTCQQLRTKARDDLAVVKGQYKSGMVEENKSSNSKNSDGVATNENKFFFDIIKWGAALIL